MMSNVGLLNTDTILSVPNATGVLNVKTVPKVPKVLETLTVTSGVVYRHVYQTSSVPKCTKCT